MTDETKPCPICGKGPAEHHGAECPFLIGAAPDDWGGLVDDFKEFMELHSNHPCPVCGREIGMWAGYDAGTGRFGVEVSCDCTRADAGDMSRAISLWLDRHRDAYRRVLDANRLARRTPDAETDIMPVGEPMDWTIRYETDGAELTGTIAAYDPREARLLLSRDEPDAHVLGVRRDA